MSSSSGGSSSDDDGDGGRTRYVEPGPRPPARRGPHERSPSQSGSGLLTLASASRAMSAALDDTSGRSQENSNAAAPSKAESGPDDSRLFVRSDARSSMFEKHFFKNYDQQPQQPQQQPPGASVLKSNRARPLSASRAQHATNTTSSSQKQQQLTLREQQQMLKRMHAGLPTSSRRLYTAPPSPRPSSAARRPSSSSSPASPTRPTASRVSSARTSPARVRGEAAAGSSRATSTSPSRPQSHAALESGVLHSSPKRPASAPAGIRAPSVSVSLSKSAAPKVALLRFRFILHFLFFLFPLVSLRPAHVWSIAGL